MHYQAAALDPVLQLGKDPTKDIETMGKKLYPTNTLEQAKTILAAWNQIDPTLVIGTVSAASLAADLERARSLHENIDRMQKKLIALRSQRDTACLDVYDKVKRARSGIKGFYGDDSTEYELAGGTRRSERKKPRRKRNAEVEEEILRSAQDDRL